LLFELGMDQIARNYRWMKGSCNVLNIENRKYEVRKAIQGGTLCRWDVPPTDIPGTVCNRLLAYVKDWMRCKTVKGNNRQGPSYLCIALLDHPISGVL
jgi:hypothetical protein